MQLGGRERKRIEGKDDQKVTPCSKGHLRCAEKNLKFKRNPERDGHHEMGERVGGWLNYGRINMRGKRGKKGGKPSIRDGPPL